MKGMSGGKSMKKAGMKMKKGGAGRKIAGATSTKFTGRLLSGKR